MNNTFGNRIYELLNHWLCLAFLFLWSTTLSMPEQKGNTLSNLQKVLGLRDEKVRGIKTIECWFRIDTTPTEYYPRWVKEVLKQNKVIPSSSNKRYRWIYKSGKINLSTKGQEDSEYRLLVLYDGKHFFYYGYTPNNEKSTTPTSVLISEISYPVDENLDSCFSIMRYLGILMDDKLFGEALKGFALKILGSIVLGGGEDCYVVEATKSSDILLENGQKKTIVDKRKFVIGSSTGALYQALNLTENNEVFLSYEAKAFKEYDGSLMLPTQMETIFYSTKSEIGENHPLLKRKVAIEKLIINSDIPDNLFKPLELQEGARIIDEGVGRTFIVGETLPTDEDIISTAKLAQSFLAGKIDLKELSELRKKGKAESYYCGPNALLAVCGILGIKTSSKEIAQLAGTDEKGFTSLAGLKRAAEALGLKAEGVDITLDELRKSKKLAIAFIPPDHFIVVVGFSADKVVIIDPPTMLGAVPLYALDTLWDGRALLLSKP
ncbi:MAG: cysteine peptidase family C39 domain-containing protein [bacterium]